MPGNGVEQFRCIFKIKHDFTCLQSASHKTCELNIRTQSLRWIPSTLQHPSCLSDKISGKTFPGSHRFKSAVLKYRLAELRTIQTLQIPWDRQREACYIKILLEGWRKSVVPTVWRYRAEEDRNNLYRVQWRKDNWIGHILCRTCLLKHISEGKRRDEKTRKTT
jgi:hypothetical protein